MTGLPGLVPGEMPLVPRQTTFATNCPACRDVLGHGSIGVRLSNETQIGGQTEAVGIAAEVNIRRVGFRSGTDAELTALHSVEVPIAAERGSHRMPQAFDAYIAFARSLPSQFEDHAWLAEAPDGTPLACGFSWSNSAGDQQVMECDVAVRRDRRQEGIGSQLFDKIRSTTSDEGRSLLKWETFDAVPAGEAFSRWLGAQPARANRTSELILTDVDWPMIEEWTKALLARENGYRLEMIDGVFPEHSPCRCHHLSSHYADRAW